MNKHEPVYLTKFVTTWILPTPLQSLYGAEVIVEQIKKIDGLDFDKIPSAVDQAYRFHKRKYAGSVVDTSVELSMDFEVNVDESNRMYPYNIFKAWGKLQYDFMTGNMSLKKDYTGSVTIEIHNKVGTVLRNIYVPVIFIAGNLNAMSLDYTSEAHYKSTVKFIAENPTDLILG